MKYVNIFLDALRLALLTDDDKFRHLSQKAIQMYEDLKKDKYPMSEGCHLYTKILQSIFNEKVSAYDNESMMALLNKYYNHPIIKKQPLLFESLKESINKAHYVKHAILKSLSQKLINSFTWYASDRITKHMRYDLNKLSNIDDIDQQNTIISKLHGDAQNLNDILGKVNYIGELDIPIDYIDMTDKDSIKSALKVLKQQRGEKAGFKSGWRGLNNILHPYGKVLRGECMFFAASSHNYKSTMLMNWARWIAAFNEVPICSGKPTIVFISLENELYENLEQWFFDIYKIAYGTSPDDLEADNVIDKVLEYFQKKGYTLLVYRKMGGQFSYQDYVKLIEDLENKGHTIVASIVDYITLMKPDKTHSIDADNWQALVRNMKNYNKHKLITLFSGIQLDTEASRLIADKSKSVNKSTINIVKKFGRAHIQKCKAIFDEADGIIFMHVEENHLGERCITLYWGKRRGVRGIPEHKKYAAYILENAIDDINGESQYLTDIYAVR